MTLQNIQDDLSAADTLEPRAKLFRGLGDPSRLAILDALLSDERSVQEIVTQTGLGQPNVSNHLRCLLDCGLVSRRNEGRFVRYRLADSRSKMALCPALCDFMRSAANGGFHKRRFVKRM